MRDIPSGLADHIEQEVTSLTRLIVLYLKTGAVLRLTTHDIDINYNGDIYLSELPVEFSAMEFTADLSVDNSEVTIGIDEDLLTTLDLKTGAFDEAAFEVYIVNWENLSDGALVLKKGTIGSITIEEGVSATLQLRGLTYLLQKPIVENYSLTCRVGLGSKKCGVVNTPTRIRANRQKVKTWDWFLVPSANETPITIANASFENGASIDDWVKPSGSLWTRANVFTAGDGSHYAQSGAASQNANIVMYQDFTTTALSLDGPTQTAGGYMATFQAQFARTSETHENSAIVYIEQFDSLGRTIQRSESLRIRPEYQTWEGISATAFILPNTTTIRLGISVRAANGGAGFIAVDVASASVLLNQSDTWGGAVFRTVKIPSQPADELFSLTNSSFDATAEVGNTNVADAISGWTIASGYWRVSAGAEGVTPDHGLNFLLGGDDGSTTPESENEIYQQRTLALGGTLAAAATSSNISNGWYAADLSVRVTNSDADSEAQVIMEFRDNVDSVISSVTTGWVNGTEDVWSTRQLSSRVPSGTVSIRIRLLGKSGAGGSAIGAAFDNVRLYFYPTAYENVNDPEYGVLGSTEPTYSYTQNNYTRDGEALVQARPLVFAYATVTDLDTQRSFEVSGIDETPASLYSGKITWLSGNNAGRSSYIRAWDNGTKIVRLYDTLPFAIQIGDDFVYGLGCSKTIDSCADTFGNAHNFRGEPYLPGPDRIVEFLSTLEVDS